MFLSKYEGLKEPRWDVSGFEGMTSIPKPVTFTSFIDHIQWPISTHHRHINGADI